MVPSFQEIADAITARVTPSLGTLTGTYRTQRLNRENWVNLINDTRLTPPYLIVEMGQRRPMPAAMDSEAYVLPVALYWVRQTSEDVVSTTYDGLSAAATALWQEPLSCCDLHGDLPTVDVTESNPANAIFYGTQTKLFAGMMSFDVRIGWGLYYES